MLLHLLVLLLRVWCWSKRSVFIRITLVISLSNLLIMHKTPCLESDFNKQHTPCFDSIVTSDIWRWILYSGWCSKFACFFLVFNDSLQPVQRLQDSILYLWMQPMAPRATSVTETVAEPMRWLADTYEAGSAQWKLVLSSSGYDEPSLVCSSSLNWTTIHLYAQHQSSIVNTAPRLSNQCPIIVFISKTVIRSKAIHSRAMLTDET